MEALLPLAGAAVSGLGVIVANQLKANGKKRQTYEEKIESRQDFLEERIQQRYEEATAQFAALTKELRDAQLQQAVALTGLTKGLENISGQLLRLGEEARADRLEVFKRINLLEQNQARHSALLEQHP